MKYKIIAGDPADLDLLEDIWYKFINYHEKNSKHFASRFAGYRFNENKEKFLQKCHGGQIKIDLVREDGKDGYGGFCISLIDSRGEGEIEAIYIEPELSKQGVGTALVSRAMAWFRENRVKQVRVEVAVGNEAVLLFYERFGFLPFSMILLNRSK